MSFGTFPTEEAKGLDIGGGDACVASSRLAKNFANRDPRLAGGSDDDGVDDESKRDGMGEAILSIVDDDGGFNSSDPRSNNLSKEVLSFVFSCCNESMDKVYKNKIKNQ